MRNNNKALVFFLIFGLWLLFVNAVSVSAAEKWQGVDESVVEKFAKEHGREAREPLMNTNKGDLLLFVFLAAGAIGGFAAGYFWRKLTEPGQPVSSKGEIDPNKS